MLDLDPGRDYVPPSTDTPVPGAGWRQDPAADGRAAAWSPEAGSTALRRPGRRESFPAGPEARAFRRRCFPNTSAAEWNDWRWQARHRIAHAGRARAGLPPLGRRARRRRAARGLAAGRHHALLRGADGPRRRRRPAAPHASPGRRRVLRMPRRGPTTRWARTTTRRCRASSTATPTASCSSSTGLLLDLLPLLHALAHGRRPGGEYQLRRPQMGDGRSRTSSAPRRSATCCSRAATR